MPSAPATSAAPRPALVWAALGIVYLVWGSTYLAIRVAIQTLPPFLMAATRFLVAGAVLFALSAPRGDRSGDRLGPAQWRATAIIGAALLLGGNGGVVWAEQRIPSGVAALLIATLALWMALLDRLIFGRRLPRRAVVGLGLGLGGLVLLVGRIDQGGVDPVGAAVCALASLSWAAGSLYARTAPLPHRPLVATSMEMLAGGALLAIAGIGAGELRTAHLAAFSTASLVALGYLIVFGSLIAFTSYVWLLRHAPTSLVATYAYVNPVVAVVLGWVLLGEPVTPRMAVAGTIILCAVALIAGARLPAPAAADTASEPMLAPPAAASACPRRRGARAPPPRRVLGRARRPPPSP
jgi:drug/metabolite transporter (DMT)-like permease